MLYFSTICSGETSSDDFSWKRPWCITSWLQINCCSKKLLILCKRLAWRLMFSLLLTMLCLMCLNNIAIGVECTVVPTIDVHWTFTCTDLCFGVIPLANSVDLMSPRHLLLLLHVSLHAWWTYIRVPTIILVFILSFAYARCYSATCWTSLDTWTILIPICMKRTACKASASDMLMF